MATGNADSYGGCKRISHKANKRRRRKESHILKITGGTQQPSTDQLQSDKSSDEYKDLNTFRTHYSTLSLTPLYFAAAFNTSATA